MPDEHTGEQVDYFFFQAEDGIRDLYVTGVQTCALPISRQVAALARWPRLIRGADFYARIGGAIQCRLSGGGRLVAGRAAGLWPQRRTRLEPRVGAGASWGACHALGAEIRQRLHGSGLGLDADPGRSPPPSH